jgi:hypothetical protein
MKLNKFLLIGIICFVAGGSLFAQSDSVRKFSLAEAQSYAIENFYVSNSILRKQKKL